MTRIELASPTVYKIKPVVDKFPIPGGMDTADTSRLLQAGFSDYMRDGIGKILWRNKTHSLLMFPKIVPTLPYETMLTVLRNTEDQPILSTMDEFENDALLEVLSRGNEARQHVVRVALEDGHKITKSYIFQHVGPSDYKQKAPYNTSYIPMHLHVHAYKPDMEKFPIFERDSDLNFSLPENKGLIRDPFVELAQEMFAISGLHSTLNPRGALVFDTQDVNHPFDMNDVQKLKQIISTWKVRRGQVVSCGTDGTIDSNDRYVPYPREERLVRLDRLLSQEDWSRVSKKSKKLLAFFFSLLQPASSDDMWNSIYKGIFGSIGYEFDATTGQRKLMVVPQNFASWYRHYRLVNEDVVVRKNKIDGKADAEVARELLPIQRRIIGGMSE